jgi:hypothetical protein
MILAKLQPHLVMRNADEVQAKSNGLDQLFDPWSQDRYQPFVRDGEAGPRGWPQE